MNYFLKGFLIILTFILINFLCQVPVQAAFSMSILDLSPGTITSAEQEINLTATISGLPSESYFRAAFQESSGATYFGYMKNNINDWVKVETSQDCKNYFKISDTATTSATFVVKVGENNQVSNGSYSIKLRRYTSTCASYSDSDAHPIQINFPTPVPTQPAQVASSSTPIPTKSPTPMPTKTPTIKPTSTPEVFETPSPTSVLGLETSVPNPEPPKRKLPVLAIIITLVGVLFIGFSIYLAYKNSKGYNI